MSYVMQNLVFGVFIPRDKLDEDQYELVINDNSILSFYNGSAPFGGGDPLIGTQLRMLDEIKPLDLTKFVCSFDFDQNKQAFNKLMMEFKNSKIFKADEFKDFDVDSFCVSLGDPRLFIIPETD